MARPKNPNLTEREMEVLQLMPDFTTAEIAEKLYLEQYTVRTHYMHIYKKLGVSRGVQAVAYGLRKKMIR